VPDTPFEGIEGAHEYVRLLADAVAEAQLSIQEDLAETAAQPGADRRVEALRLVEYKLGQLTVHITAASRLLNDLRTLRRLLFNERGEA
jgi:hypothetical protein